MEWFTLALRRYTRFSGRSRRKEYWFFTLFFALGAVALGMADLALGLYSESTGLGLLGSLWMLAMLVPSTTVTVRRFHDTGRSGWWLLVFLVPLIGLLGLYFMVKDGDPGANEYGPDPKQEPLAA